MIRKLQYKFIMISGVAVFIVIAALLLLLNQFFYSNVLRQSYKALQYIAKCNGELPDDYSKDTVKQFGNRIITLRDQLQYFSVWTNHDTSSIDKINLDHISSVSYEEAEKYTSEVLSHDWEKGLIRDDDMAYCYLIKDQSEGKLIVFLDCSWDYMSIRELRIFSFWFSLICLGFFLIVVSALSRRAIRPVIRNMENQKQFITNAGHELKTPLAIISANTEVLMMLEGENEWTRSTMNQVDRLNRLVANLITLSKMGEVNEEERKEVDFSSLVKKTSEDFRTLAGQQGLTFEEEIEPGLVVKGVESHLKELVNILCDNAVKYCDEKGQISVLLKKRTRTKGILMEISNSYAAGADLDCSRMFERFYRGDASHNSEKAGYGIGLAMAEGFVEESKGKISAAYKDGVITFTVVLP